MYLKTNKETKRVNQRRGVKLLTVVPVAVLILSALTLSSVIADGPFKEETIEATNSFSTVTTEYITEATTEVTTETTTEIQIIEESTVNPITESEPVILEPVLSYNTSTKSNLTEDQYNQILSGTPLAGCGYAFKDIEDTYGVNGIFALSVALNETSYGAAGVGNSKNNVFSNTKASGGYIYFDNKIDSIYYFGAYIPRVQWGNGRYYIGDIAPSYCDTVWGDKVESSMYDIFERIN